METTTNPEANMTITTQTYSLGTTIHDETVAITEVRKDRWEITLDGLRLGRLDCFEGKLTAASLLIPEHRRTGALTLLPFRTA